jgi:hypothetical protein
MLKDALDAPETTAGEDSHFGRCLRVRRFIERRRRDRSCTLRRRREPAGETAIRTIDRSLGPVEHKTGLVPH